MLPTLKTQVHPTRAARKDYPKNRAARLRQSLAFVRRHAWPTQGPFVLVNAAADTLVAWEDGKPRLEMTASCGCPATPTPIQADGFFESVTNPEWFPPRSVLADPEWRARLSDPGWAARHGFERRNGSVVQKPGPKNVLGEWNFPLDGGGAILLHGTNDPSLFAGGGGRADPRSRGCVRLESPLDLAAWAVGGDVVAMPDIVRSGSRRPVAARGRIPVLLGYLTAFPNARGGVDFHRIPTGG